MAVAFDMIMALQLICHVCYAMLLNPDTIVRERAIRALVDFMDSHQCAGIAGSRLHSSKLFQNFPGVTLAMLGCEEG